MATSTQTGFARVTIVAPRSRVDVSLPLGSTLAELLPQLLHLVGEDPTAQAADHGEEWVLSRVGEPGLDTSRTTEALGIRDGEMLYLAEQRTQPPPPVFDDVAEAIGHVARGSTSGWKPSTTRVTGLVSSAILLVFGALVVTTATPGWLSAIMGFVVAVVLVGSAAALSRAGSDSLAGAFAAGAGLAYAFCSGLALFLPAEGIVGVGAPQVVVAFTTLTVFAIISILAVGDYTYFFVSVAIVGAIGLVASLLGLATGASAAAVAAGAAAVAVAFGPTLPGLSLRFSGLHMPALPQDASDLNRDAEQLPTEKTLDQSALADRYLSGMLGATAGILLVAEVLLAASGSMLAMITAAAIALSAMLRARAYARPFQRYAMLVVGLAGVALLAAGLVAVFGIIMQLAIVLVALLVGGGSALGAGLLVPNSRPSPYWGRFFDIIEIMLLTSVIPLTLGIMGVYQWVRALSG